MKGRDTMKGSWRNRMGPGRGSTLRVVLLTSLAAWVGSAASALPDLTVDIRDPGTFENQPVDPEDVAEGCAGGTTDRRLIRFGLRTDNIGPDDLVMGDPGCPPCATNPGAACTNPLYVCSPAHGHEHFEQYALAELVDDQGNVLATGQKQGFCLLDSFCADPTYTCGFQGISAGCADVYTIDLPCQYIDITDAAIPAGEYTLRVTVDYDNLIPEEDDTNNSDEVRILVGDPAPGCGNGILEDGELCDDGNTLDGDCCSSTCTAAADDGTACSDPASCRTDGQCLAGACTGGSQDCDACLTCLPPEGCVVPTGSLCADLPPKKSSISIRRKSGRPDKDRIDWKWTAAAPVTPSDFGSPDVATELSLCVYDEGGLVGSSTAPAGGTCNGKPCWTATEKKIRLRDKTGQPDGVRKLTLRPGDAGKARIQAQSRGEVLGLPLVPLDGAVTVRLQRGDSPACWESRFPEAQRNDFERYKARIRSD